MNYPSVSIIVPCYNQCEFLDTALESVHKQTFQNWNCIIINDGSTDESEKVAKGWIKKDSRFKYVFQKNQGVSTTRNNGINYINSEFILPLDADDKISMNYLEECLRVIKSDNNVKVVFGEIEMFGEKRGELKLGDPTLANILNNNCIPSSGIFRRSDWVQTGGYDPGMVFGFEDWEFWINLLKRGGIAKKTESCILYYRIKKTSRSTEINSDKNKIESMRDFIFRKHIDAFGYSSTYDMYRDKLLIENKLKNYHQENSFGDILFLLGKKIKNIFF